MRILNEIMGEKRIWECEDRKRGMEEDGGSGVAG